MFSVIDIEIWDLIVSKLTTNNKIRFYSTCKEFYRNYNRNKIRSEALIDVLNLGNESGLLLMKTSDTWHKRANIRSIIRKVVSALKNNNKTFNFTTGNMNRFDRFICYNIFRPLNLKVKTIKTDYYRICDSSFCSECRIRHFEEEQSAYLTITL